MKWYNPTKAKLYDFELYLMDGPAGIKHWFLGTASCCKIWNERKSNETFYAEMHKSSLDDVRMYLDQYFDAVLKQL